MGLVKFFEDVFMMFCFLEKKTKASVVFIVLLILFLVFFAGKAVATDRQACVLVDTARWHDDTLIIDGCQGRTHLFSKKLMQVEEYL